MLYLSRKYNLNFDVSAIIICVLLLLYLIVCKNLRIRRIRTYIWIVLCMLLTSTSELAIDIYRNSNGISFSNQLAEATTFVMNIANCSIPFFLLLYFLSLTGLWHGMKKKHFALIGLPETVLVLSHLIPPVRHRIYYYYGNFQYAHGPWYCLYYIIVAAYIAGALWTIITYRNSIRKRTLLYIFILGDGYLLGIIIAIIDPYIRITNFIQMIVLAGSFFIFGNDDNLVDEVTGVYNTRELVNDTYPLFHTTYRSYIISIKLQDINDYRLMIGLNEMSWVFHQIGEWMLGLANENLHFYRTGSGEFAALLYNSDKDQADQLAGLIHDRFKQPWKYSAADDADLTIPAQIWVSSIPDRISTEEQVLSFSESDFIPDLPQNQIYVADEMKQENRKMQVSIAIRRAITNNTFEVYYQPIYDTVTGKIHSCEALVRMRDPNLGQVSPEEFIKVAEKTGTVARIGSIVFEKVCQFIAEKKPEQYGMDFIEVNLSPIQCMNPNLTAEFRETMDKYGVHARQIVLEITESAVIHNANRVNNVIQDLQKEGFEFALDDFGTGQANYSYLQEFPFSIIKIDKGFLWAAEKNDTDKVVLRDMIELVKDLHLQTVVEGVETEYQRDHLIAYGVDYLQGYYYSKPVPEDQFVKYIREFNEKAGAPQADRQSMDELKEN